MFFVFQFFSFSAFRFFSGTFEIRNLLQAEVREEARLGEVALVVVVRWQPELTMQHDRPIVTSASSWRIEQPVEQSMRRWIVPTHHLKYKTCLEELRRSKYTYVVRDKRSVNSRWVHFGSSRMGACRSLTLIRLWYTRAEDARTFFRIFVARLRGFLLDWSRH